MHLVSLYRGITTITSSVRLYITLYIVNKIYGLYMVCIRCTVYLCALLHYDLWLQYLYHCYIYAK